MNNVKILDSNKIYSGNISIRIDKFKFYDKTIEKEIVEHSPSVGLIPIINDNKEILLVYQYRHAIGKMTLEIPAGKIEINETAEQAAIRELREETGHSGKLKSLFSWYLAPGYDTEIMNIFLATNLKKIGNTYGVDDDEKISLKKMKLKSAIQKCMNGEINDSKTVAAILIYSHYINRDNNLIE